MYLKRKVKKLGKPMPKTEIAVAKTVLKTSWKWYTIFIENN